jgi:carboxymethylenebutenolidase
MPTSTIEISTPDGVVEALLVRTDDGEHPGVLMYPDALGLRPAFARMAERVARWGYTVLLPNYFYRTGTAEDLAPKADLRSPEGQEAMAAMNLMKRITSVSPAEAIADAKVFVETLRSAPGVAGGDIATVGYCFGGLQAIRAAEARPDAVAATGAFHTGRLVTDERESVHRHFGEARAEFYLGHADHDPSATPEIIAAVEAALTDAGREYASEVYVDARHGYAVPDTMAFHEDAAEQHYDRLRSLLARTISRD